MIDTSDRLISLDALRGLTIAAMILVNSPGDWGHVYPPLQHAAWHGMTLADLVFPFFIFVMGVSVVLGYGKQRDAGRTFGDVFPKILRRTLILMALGLLLNLVAQSGELRIAGVLQRIGLVFLFCAMLYMTTSWRTQLLVTSAILLGYWLALSFIPYPGGDAGTLEPGNNLAAWIDRMLLPGAMYQGNWDPEGLASTLPAIASGLTGVLGGHLVRSDMPMKNKLYWLTWPGLACIVIGIAWSTVFPLNKNLWTSSYVLCTSGLAAALLAVSIYLIDVLGIRRGMSPWLIFGANSITVYVLHGLLFRPLQGIPVTTGEPRLATQPWFNQSLVSAGMAPEFVSLLWAVAYTGLCFVPIWVMYRKGWFVRI